MQQTASQQLCNRIESANRLFRGDKGIFATPALDGGIDVNFGDCITINMPRCPLADAIGEFQSLAVRCRMTAQWLAGVPISTPEDVPSHHLMIPRREPEELICGRIEKAFERIFDADSIVDTRVTLGREIVIDFGCDLHITDESNAVELAARWINGIGEKFEQLAEELMQA